MKQIMQQIMHQKMQVATPLKGGAFTKMFV